MNFKLNEITIIQSGVSLKTRIQNDPAGEYPVILMKDLSSENILKTDSLFRISTDKIKQHHILKKGDIVFRSRGENLHPAIINDDIGNLVLASPLISISIKKDNNVSVLPEYIHWYLQQKPAQQYFQKVSEGSLLRMISVQQLSNIAIPVPSLEKQELVVEISHLIDKELKIIETLSLKRKLLTNALLFKVIW
ncbi:MAG: restriction endonuclease subunit S [Spirochaetes bacterium]|nr:restriction endonuclease subunit S [Spirochaetota bacterium]